MEKTRDGEALPRGESERRFGEFLGMAQDMQTVLRAIVDPVCAEHGINRLSLIILNHLLLFPGQAPSRLAPLLGVQKTNFATQCRKLEEEGFLARTQSEDDRRSFSLTVTGKGERLVGEIRARVEEVEEELSAAVLPDVRDNMERNWRIMREAVADLARAVSEGRRA